jgi:hypothetical protein
MATEAQVKTEIADTIGITEDLRNWLYVDANNYLTREASLVGELHTDYSDIATGALQNFRSRMNAGMQDGANVVAAFMFDMAKALNLPGANLGEILEQLRVYYAENTRRVKSRAFTRGTPTADGSNTGTGVINRLTVDEYGFAIETGFAESLKARCTRDVSNGASKHEEEFTFEGSALDRDRIRITGTGVSPVSVRAISARESLDIVANCSFDVYQGDAAAPSDITNWTPTTAISNFDIDTSLYYRDYEGSTAPASLILQGNDVLSQAFTVRSFRFDPFTPYYAQIALNRNGTGADGTFSFVVGNITVTVDLTTLGASGWELLRIPIGTSNWYRNFKKTSPTFSVGLSGGSTFGCRADDLIVAPYRRQKGTWYAPVGGATKWLFKDFFAWTDSEVGAIIQYFLAYWYDRYLPSSTSSTLITWTEPT